uniref:Protein ABIL1 n=1 Tax=Anthurium amnicola TaxID=1678845 RepID=A0A1D1ZIT0_9ARAE
MQQCRPDAPAMTVDEVSMERSKSFVKALQELKNLRPQLYSAAEYCEKSYLHNEQKQMVLDNLKDYAVRALVNAVDHLGTVAYKLTDLFEQQTGDVSTLELKVSYLNQQILTCQSYMDKDSLRQQQLIPNCPRHHKHYILPNPGSKGLHNPNQTSLHPHPPGTPASKTLLWHLASESNSASNGSSNTPLRNEDSPDVERGPLPYTLSQQIQSSIIAPGPDAVCHTFILKDTVNVPKHLSGFRSFDNPGRREIIRPPARSKSMLSAFFAKNKYAKQKKAIAL